MAMSTDSMDLARTYGVMLDIFWFHSFLDLRTINAVESKFFPKTMYVDKLCNSRLVVRHAVKVQIWHPPDHTECTVYFSPETGDALVAKFVFYKNEQYFAECAEESIQLRAGEQALLGPNGYCDRETPDEDYDLGDNGSLTYVHKVFHHKLTATLLITEVFRRLLLTAECSNNSFYCSEQKFCIDRTLVCNAYDDCGNNEDERNWCGYTPLLTVLAIAVLLCGLTIALLLCFFSYTRRKKKDLMRYDHVTYRRDGSGQRRNSTPHAPFYMTEDDPDFLEIAGESREGLSPGPN